MNLGPVTIRAGVPRVRAKLTKLVASYPALPQGPAIDHDDPDASFMLSRLDLYRQGREPLADVAYLCLTVVEDSAFRVSGGQGSKRKGAAMYYQIEERVLNMVGELSSRKGGPLARKSEGRSDPFTKEETLFLEAAVAVLTRRSAEKAADPNGSLSLITMADLPKPT